MTRILALVLLICVASPAWAVPFCGGELVIKDRYVLRDHGTPGDLTKEIVTHPHDDVIAVLYADAPVTVPAGTTLFFVYEGRGWRVPTTEILYPLDRAESCVATSRVGFVTSGARTARSGGWVLVLRFPLGTINTLDEWEPDEVEVQEGGER